MIEQPQQYNPETVDDTLAYLTRFELNETIATYIANVIYLAGGDAAYLAFNPYSYPPCSPRDQCEKCWCENICAHTELTESGRVALETIQNFLYQDNSPVSDLEKVTKAIEDSLKHNDIIALYLLELLKKHLP